MSPFAVFALCLQVCLIQSVMSQDCGCNRRTVNLAPNAYASPVLSSNRAYGSAGAGYGSGYGGVGTGQVTAVGDVSACGETTLEGSVPVLGQASFGGTLPASGFVSIAGQCGCGCGI